MAKPRVSEVVRDVYMVTIGRAALSTNVYLIRSRSSWTLVDAGWSGSEQKIGGGRVCVRAIAAGIDGVDPLAS
jgi:hypothetical protein